MNDETESNDSSEFEDAFDNEKDLQYVRDNVGKREGEI